MVPPTSPSLMLTGATGFLGRYILRELLKQGAHVAVLLRPPAAQSLNRLYHGVAEFGFDIAPFLADGRLNMVEGALPQDLPVSVPDGIDAVVHSAASLQLMANGSGEPYDTNARGVERLIEWADRLGIRTIHAVSTAYVSGWTRGEIPESIHLEKPTFQTDYEHSKWLAEIALHDWSKTAGHSLTLLRPSFLIGDSQTGYTSQFGGFYQLARLVQLLKQRHAETSNGRASRITLRIPGLPEDVHNLVPIDFAARMIAHIVLNAEHHGRVYHLTNPNPPSNLQMKRFFENYYGLEGGSFVDPTSLNGNRTHDEWLIWNDLMQPRIGFSPHFLCDNTAELMQRANIRFPQLHDARLSRILDFAMAKQWGRIA